jgi:predicted DNA-binding transcriptional regulator AlpA
MRTTSNEKPPEELLTEHDVAQLLKVSVATIRRRRLFRQPPDFVKLGASVRYRREAIERLIESAEQHMGARPSGTGR